MPTFKTALAATVVATALMTALPEPSLAQGDDPVLRLLNSIFQSSGSGPSRSRWNDDDDNRGGWNNDDGYGGHDDDDDGSRDDDDGGNDDDD
jgi:hypothetical protein